MTVRVIGPKDQRVFDQINTTSRSDNWSRGLSPFLVGQSGTRFRAGHAARTRDEEEVVAVSVEGFEGVGYASVETRVLAGVLEEYDAFDRQLFRGLGVPVWMTGQSLVKIGREPSSFWRTVSDLLDRGEE